MSNPTTEERIWRQHIAKFVTSGLPQKAFCDKHKLKLSAFHKWRYALKSDFPVSEAISRSRRGQRASQSFVPIEITPSLKRELPSAQSLKIHFDRHSFIELPFHVPDDVLESIVRAIRRAAC